MGHTTNASSILTAKILADSRIGTFAGLVTTLKGEEKGRGADKKVYGDDQVHVVLFTGFDYIRLVKRSLKALDKVTDAQIVADDIKYQQKLVKDAGGSDDDVAAVVARFTEADVALARAEMVESFNKTLAGTNESTTDDVYEPLVVDGETVRGSKVYRCKRKSGKDGECYCRDCVGWTPDMKGKKPPVDGTIMLTGLKVWQKVLTPAANGPAPEPNSSAKTLAKNALRHVCPVRKFVQYSLEPRGNWMLHAGGTAALEATNRGFIVTDDILNTLAD